MNPGVFNAKSRVPPVVGLDRLGLFFLVFDGVYS